MDCLSQEEISEKYQIKNKISLLREILNKLCVASVNESLALPAVTLSTE